MLLAFMLMVCGLWFAFRISRQITSQNIFSNKQMTKIGTIYFGTVFCLSLMFARTFLVLWLLIFVPQIFFFLLVYCVRKWREKKFRQQFYSCLNNTILKMKTGKSLRQAFTEMSAESDPLMQQKLSEILEIVVFSQQNSLDWGDQFVKRAIVELRSADQNSHSSLRTLTAFRDRLRMEDDFRRRSGQVLQQIRFQSILITALYFAVLAFVGHEFGIKKNVRLISSSLLFFAIGLLWIQIGGRRLKWKV